MPGMPWTSEMVCIGRGAKAHGLAASVWGNPWKVSAVGRDVAVANYKEHLAKSEDLQGRLRGLSGKTLVCHCGDLDRCHGDTIIEAFELGVAKQEKVANDSSVEDLDSGNEGPQHKLGRKGHLSEFVVKASGVSSSMAAVFCALLESGRLAKGGSLTRRQCGACGGHWWILSRSSSKTWRLAAWMEKFSSSAFSSGMVVDCRSSLESALKVSGIDVVQNETEAPQAIRVRWLQAVALGVADPDAHFASMVAGGVNACDL